MATTWRGHVNYPSGITTLASTISDSDTTIGVATGTGANCIKTSNFTVTFSSGEIVLVGTRSGDTLSGCTRGYNGSTATGHLAGESIEMRFTEKDIVDIETAVNGIEDGTTALAKVSVLGTVANSMIIDDAATNTVLTVLGLYHKSTGTPASGLGARLEMGSEDSAGNTQAAAYLDAWLTTVTNGAEVGAFALKLVNAGAFSDVIGITPSLATFAVPITLNSNTNPITQFVSSSGTESGVRIQTVSPGKPYLEFRFAGDSSTWNIWRDSSNNLNMAYGNRSTTAMLSISSAGAVTIPGAFQVDGNTTLGNANTDTITCLARLLPRDVNDAGPMTATGGTKKEVVYNLANDKLYVCTVTHATAATWSALN